MVDALIAAAREGDFERLLEVLHPDITWTTSYPLGNGEPGVTARSRTGKPLGLTPCVVRVGG